MNPDQGYFAILVFFSVTISTPGGSPSTGSGPGRRIMTLRVREPAGRVADPIRSDWRCLARRRNWGKSAW
jgi:hypothetical protein